MTKVSNARYQSINTWCMVEAGEALIDSKCPKGPSATYNLLALLNTRLDLGNVAGGIVIGKLFNLAFAYNG